MCGSTAFKTPNDSLILRGMWPSPCVAGYKRLFESNLVFFDLLPESCSAERLHEFCYFSEVRNALFDGETLTGE